MGVNMETINIFIYDKPHRSRFILEINNVLIIADKFIFKGDFLFCKRNGTTTGIIYLNTYKFIVGYRKDSK